MADARIKSYLDGAAAAVAAGRFEEAASLERLAADRTKALGNPPEEQAALLDAGARRQYARGDLERATDTLVSLVAFRRKLGDHGGEVDALHRLGLCAQAAGRHDAAIKRFDTALATAARHFPPSYPVNERIRAARTVSVRYLGSEPAPAVAPVPPPAIDGTVEPETLDDILAELDALVGLHEVKARIRALAEFQRVQGLRGEAGLKRVAVSQHLAFTGSPGTGKTTVARLYGRILHALGILATDTLVEASRAQLIAGFVGQTAKRVDDVVDSALDGVLFVDEAYALTQSGSEKDFGAEAVAQLLTRMENDRDRLAVIFAGYSEPMTDFMASNPGLESRIGEVIEFPDYTPGELTEIFLGFARTAEYELAPAAVERLRAVLDELHAARDASFGNARTVRNLFEDAIVAHAGRLAGAGPADRARLLTIEPADIDVARASAD